MHGIEAEKLKRRGWEEENIIKLKTELIKEIARRDSAVSESTDRISVIVQVERSGKDLRSTSEDRNLKSVFEKISSFAASPEKNRLTNSVAAEISSTQIKEIAKDPTVTRIELNTALYFT
jgi:hypothetical protein